MKLQIGSQTVEMNQVLYVEGGHFLQILVTPNKDLTLHRVLTQALRQNSRSNGGVMDVEIFEAHEGHPDMSEIRVLAGGELEVIDLARLNGYGVRQKL